MATPVRRPWNSFFAVLITGGLWILAPAVLFWGSYGAGLPHGQFHHLVATCTFWGFSFTRTFPQQVCVLSVPAAMAAAAPPDGNRLIAVISVVAILIYGWCSTGDYDYPPRPSVYKFIRDWKDGWFDQIELRGELPDDCKSKCCFAFHPHGVACIGFSFNGAFHPYFEKAGKINWLIHFKLRYCVPSFRWLCDAMQSENLRVHDVTRETVAKDMATGENVALIAGGVLEAVAYAYGKDCTAMKKRKTLIKFCLQFGYRIFPIYTFGESTTFHCFTGLRGLRIKVGQAGPLPPIFFFGWPKLPFLPRQDSRVITYIGAGLDVPHIEEPTPEQVDLWHARYLEALNKLFEEKKGEAGFPDAKLEII